MNASRPASSASLEMIRWIGWAQRKAAEEWIRDRELSREQAFVLGFLVKNPGAMQRDIADASGTSAGSMTSLLQGLERRLLVERRTQEGNARVKRVYVTSAGAKLIEGFEEAMADADAVILSPLDDEERATLHQLLSKITVNIQKPSRP